MIVLCIHVYLVSTHIVCERLSAMQDLAWVLRICAQNSKNTLFLADQEYPSIGTSCNSIPLGARGAYYGKVRIFISAA